MHPLTKLITAVTEANKTWWIDINSGEPKERNVGEMLMLVTSELAEAMEGHRESLNDDKLPQYKMFDVEVIDALIRLFDICGHLVPGAADIFEAKMYYNAHREDHKVEQRLKDNGKKY